MPHNGERPVRVCYVVSYFHPFASGAERQALAQGQELVRRGHAVHVVTRAVPGYPIVDEEHHGVFIHRWIKTAAFGPLFGLTFVSGVARALFRLRSEIDVVHTHQALWEAVSTGLARPLLLGTPTLVQPASAGSYGEADELLRTRGAIWLAARSCATPALRPSRPRSNGNGARWESKTGGSYAWPAASIRTIFDLGRVPSRPASCRARAWSSPGACILRRTSRSCSRPGSKFRAARRPISSWSGRATIESGSPSSPARWPSRIAFSSPALSTTRPITCCAADLFVLPSVAEGMSNSLLEAMATALPAVASGIGGNTDLIDDGQTGRLVATATPGAWSQALVELLENPGEARRMGEAARRRIDLEFALGVVVDRYLDLYRRMIAGSWPEASGRR